MTRAHVRLAVLFTVLLAVTSWWLVKTIQNSAGAPQCSPGALAQTQKLSLVELDRLVSRTGLRALRGEGTSDMEGLQRSAAAWSDGFPLRSPRHPTPSTRVDAGYEIRWWAGDQDHQVVDLLAFPSAKAASRYLAQAASTRCRPRATTYSLESPPGARAVVWSNPLKVRQADVYFSRANRIYRVIDITPYEYDAEPGRLSAQELIDAVQLLACRLRQAACRPTPPAPTLSFGGYRVLWTMVWAAGKLRTASPVSAAGLLARACEQAGAAGDLQARLVEQGCQASTHYVRDFVNALECHRAHEPNCDEANLEAAGYALERAAWSSRELARRLTGRCRSGVLAGAELDHQLADSYTTYAHALVARDASKQREAQIRDRMIARQMGRPVTSAFAGISACAPSPRNAAHESTT